MALPRELRGRGKREDDEPSATDSWAVERPKKDAGWWDRDCTYLAAGRLLAASYEGVQRNVTRRW
jgi:hypothetical protein